MVTIATPRSSFRSTIDDALARILRDATAELVEPRGIDAERALRLLDSFVETITGFAAGTIFGEVLAAVRRTHGAEAAAGVRARLHGWPDACAGGEPSDRPYLADAAQRPLVDQLARALHVRFCRMSRDVRVLLGALEIAGAADAVDARATAELLADRLPAELAFGWSMYIAVLAGTALPPRGQRSARSQALWLAWEHQLLGRPVVARGEHEQAGYIMLVS